MSKVQVKLLSDLSEEENQESVDAAAYLINTVSNDAVVTMVAKHSETGKLGTIICSMVEDPKREGIVQYIPVAILFTHENMYWTDYDPPLKALEPVRDPMSILEEDEDIEDAEDISEETT